ncbi:hypothetical protein SLEP1_g27272 [Rubroshorea leprosula]|uniref:Plastid movement impaired 2 n=1 Tax=Rubroshorea leprosula TaxID=152421 RepID=A0AAV5JPW3_9ROSI|nr:hypothetical protein SLEP1_g27272 [Rubroshorea leprosula]
MGNTMGRRKKARIMKIDGETFKLKTPVRAWDVVKDYPGHVLLDSEAVKHFGIRAKPLEAQQELKPKKIYFLVELPKFTEEKTPRRARSSGIQMSAKDRLECLMLSRRAASDLSAVKAVPAQGSDGPGEGIGPVKVKLRLPKAQVAKLMEESRDGTDVAEKIIGLYMGNSGDNKNSSGRKSVLNDGINRHGIGEKLKARERRVSFISSNDGEIQLASP